MWVTDSSRATQLAAKYDDECDLLRVVGKQESEHAARYLLLHGSPVMPWAEVVILYQGAVFVHSELSSVFFGYCGERCAPREVVGWLATHNYEYAADKATVAGNTGWCWDPLLALGQTCEARRKRKITKAHARKVVDWLHGGADQLAVRRLAHWLPELGICAAPNVFLGQAVLRRLKIELTTVPATFEDEPALEPAVQAAPLPHAELTTGWQIVCPDGQVRHPPYAHYGDAECDARMCDERGCGLFRVGAPSCDSIPHTVEPLGPDTVRP